jgi:RHS repeat-associated protein
VDLVFSSLTPVGTNRQIWFRDLVVASLDGAVYPLYTGQTSMTTTTYGTAANPSAAAQRNAPAGVWPALTTSFYHGDHLGTSRLMTSTNGYPIWQGTFLPYGEEFAAQPLGELNRYKFTGKERDTESGLDYFGARFDASSMGRFMSPDPENASGFDYMDDPQSWNGYAYVRNNPTLYVDPDGREYEYCSGTDANGKGINCTRGHSDAQQAEDAKINKFKDGKIYSGDTVVGTYRQIDVDLPGDPEANRQAAAMIVAQFDEAMVEFGKNAAYAATGAVIGKVVGTGIEAIQAARAAKSAAEAAVDVTNLSAKIVRQMGDLTP